MGSGVGLLVRKIRMNMTVVVKSGITHYSSDLMFLASNFYYCSKNIFHSKCACLGASKYPNVHWKLRFPAFCNMQKYKIFCPSG